MSKYIVQYSWVMSGVGSWTSPFGDKIHESLRFNSGMGDIPDAVAHEFECPLGDLSYGVALEDDVPERV